MTGENRFRLLKLWIEYDIVTQTDGEGETTKRDGDDGGKSFGGKNGVRYIFLPGNRGRILKLAGKLCRVGLNPSDSGFSQPHPHI